MNEPSWLEFGPEGEAPPRTRRRWSLPRNINGSRYNSGVLI